MNIYYNGVDIYEDISLNYAVHEMFAEKQADSLVLRFNDPKGNWSEWEPAEGDEIQLKEGYADTGTMYVHRMTPENGFFTVRALSIPLSAKNKNSNSWEGVRLLQLGEQIAEAHGLAFDTYYVTDQVYPYIAQDDETDLGFLSRLATLEGCQLIVYDGRLILYDEAELEAIPPTGELEIGENGVFAYYDNRSKCYGSCEVASGSCSGSADADGDYDNVLRPAGIRATTDGEADRFAAGLLRNANKYAFTGRFTKALQTEFAAASLVELVTPKASMWNGPVFVYKVRHDYVRNASTIYFRKLQEEAEDE